MKNTYTGGAITAEQFLFHEMRIVAKMFLAGMSIDEVVAEVGKNNLFQYPTERQLSRMSRTCYKRLIALDDEQLVHEIVNARSTDAKQIVLYSMMCHYNLVRDFMISVIGEKYRTLDYSFSHRDVNTFMSRIQEQNENAATWSDASVTKIKQVLTKCLTEVQIIDTTSAEKLNTIFICDSLKDAMLKIGDRKALMAFNYFE